MSLGPRLIKLTLREPLIIIEKDELKKHKDKLTGPLEHKVLSDWDFIWYKKSVKKAILTQAELHASYNNYEAIVITERSESSKFLVYSTKLNVDYYNKKKEDD